MKKIFLYVVSVLTFSGIIPYPASAGFSVPDGTPFGLINEPIFDTISNLMNWLLGLVGILAVIGFVIAGILYLTSAGDEDQAKKAKTIMVYTIIGMTVAFIGLIVVNTIAGITGGGGGAIEDY